MGQKIRTFVAVDIGPGVRAALQSAIADAVQALGFPRDRETFTPHLTIARVRRHSSSRAADLSALDSLVEQSFGVCSIDEVIVFASYLDKKGPTYVPMSTISLSY